MADKLESKFQAELIAELEDLLPGCVILKNDPDYLQGIPDLTVFYNDKWAWLECKRSAKAEHQPNQDYYIELGNTMGYAAFVYPENKERVLYEVQRALKLGRKTRVSQRKQIPLVELHRGEGGNHL